MWAPDYPRRASTAESYQEPVDTAGEVCRNLYRAADAGRDGFISTYSFPDGHSREGNLPKIDSIFVDFDIEGERYDPDNGMSRQADWEVEMSDLLVRVRRVAEELVESGEDVYWRASLSGHKGIHLFLDFPPLDHEIGSFQEFKQGLNEYADVMIESLDEIAGGIGIEEWVDVDSADLGRLVRMPNTPHHGVAYTNETKYCVPVTVRELSEMDVERYKRLTDSPRSCPFDGRRESESAQGKIRQAIINSEVRSSSTLSQTTAYSRHRVNEYRERSDDSMGLRQVRRYTSDKPFLWEFRERDDAFQKGQESRIMELFVVLEFMYHNVPIDVMVEFFRPIPGFREGYTRNLVKDLVSRDYGRMSLRKVREEAPTFYGENRHD